MEWQKYNTKQPSLVKRHMFSDTNAPIGVGLYKNGGHCTCRNDPIVLGNKRVYVGV